MIDTTHAPNFETISSLNEARSLFGYTLCKDSVIYVAGGVGASKKTSNTDTIERYSILDNKWTFLNIRLPQKLCGVSCVYFEEEDKIKIFGGSDHLKKNTKSVFELDLKTEKVSEVNSMNTKRQMNNKVFRNKEKLFLLGGNPDSDCEMWNLNSRGRDHKMGFNYGNVVKGDLNNFCGFTI